MKNNKTVFLIVLISLTIQLSSAQKELHPTNISVTKDANYHLVWQDNFDGTTLDELNNWNIEVNGDGGGNNELQYYRRENISVGTEPVSGANCLIIKGKKEGYLGKTCTSGRLNTLGKMSFTQIGRAHV